MPFSVASGMMDGVVWGVQPIFRARAARECVSSTVGPSRQLAAESDSSSEDVDESMHDRARTLSEGALEEAISRDRRDRSHQFTPLSQLLGYEQGLD